MRKLNITGSIVCEIKKMDNGGLAKIEIADSLLGILAAPLSREGFLASQMLSSIEVMRKIKTAQKDVKAFVLLEEAEYQNLVNAINGFRFPFADPAIYDWINGIINLPVVEVETVKAKCAKETHATAS